ncbi:unnamed protein product [Caenorhabditis auriculariae]|uniref:Uncharacterized protein n=1 Tax=Caenorhabditis auriculariae TaxID=2777116 RepID=A0A8S1HX98_9PELO|nr:unnamed protein product [Caenorhabditis auriculariae]
MDDSYAIAQPYADYYESIFREFNPRGLPTVPAGEAAAFLKRSNLPMPVLGQIWELADQRKIGALDKRGAYVAFKLVAAAQNGKPLNSPGLLYDSSLGMPKFGLPMGSPAPPGGSFQHSPVSAAQWAIPQQDQAKYDSIFASLGPVNGKVSGVAVRPVLLNSGLDGVSLARIWELSDQDKDGQLDRIEMSIALHLVYKALQNEPIPSELPSSLIHPSKAMLVRRTSNAGSLTGVPAYPPRPLFGSRAGSVTSLDEGNSGGFSTLPKPAARAVSVQPSHYMNGQNGRTSGCSTPLGSINREVGALTGSVSVSSLTENGHDWPVSTAEHEALFSMCDGDHDGFVSGADVKGPLLGTGLSPQMLAHVWSLVDSKRIGRLNLEQFALTMFLVQMAKRGETLPQELPHYLIPPSMRPPIPSVAAHVLHSEHNQSVSTPQLPEATSMEIKEALECENEEMRQLAEAIQSMQADRRKAEENIVQLEADMTIKNSRIKNLQIELTTLEGTVKQLERQKGEANRRLADFDTQIEQLKAACDAQREKKSDTETRMTQIQEDARAGEETRTKDLEEMEALKNDIAQMEMELNGLNGLMTNEKAEREKIVAEETALEIQEARDKAQEARLKEAIASTNAANEALVKAVEGGDVAEFVTKNPAALHTHADESLMSDATVYTEASTSSSSAGHVTQTPFGPTPTHSQPFQPDPHFPTDPFAQADPFASTPSAAFGTAFPADPFSSAFPAEPFGGDSHPTPPKAAAAPPPRPAPPKSARQTPVTDPFGAEAPAPNANFANFADFGAAFN